MLLLYLSLPLCCIKNISMNTKLFFTVAGVCFFFISSCKKETPAPEPSAPLVFSSLTLERDTINPGGTTKVIATAAGDNINYQWYTTHGDLFGSGSTVTFGAAPCCVSNDNRVYCTISDGKNSESKYVPVIVVLP